MNKAVINQAVDQTESSVFLKNDEILLEISKSSGEWLRLSVNGKETINYKSLPVVPVDFSVDGKWVIEENGCVYLGCEGIRGEGDRIGIEVKLGVREYPAIIDLPQSLYSSNPSIMGRNRTEKRYEYEVSCIYTIGKDLELRRKIKVRRNKENSFRGVKVIKFECFLFKFPGVIVGCEDDCMVDMPNSIIMGDAIKPRILYSNAKEVCRIRGNSPDFDMGVVSIHNRKENKNITVWNETLDGEIKTCYSSCLIGNGTAVTVVNKEEFASYIMDTGEIVSHENVIRFGVGYIEEGLKAYADYIGTLAPPRTDIPAWVKNSVFMEVDPAYYGGYNGIKEKLSILSEVGFNAIYLMPLNINGYAIYDHYSLDERYGTVEELKEMIKQAHKFGIKVLFDLLIVIQTHESKLINEHPEYFVRDEVGRIMGHTDWGNASTDYGNPGYRKYIVDFTCFCVREYGIDGFRVDSPGSKSPNWYPHSGTQPYETLMGCYKMMQEVNNQIKKINPEAILLDEVGGPAFFHVCDICHNFGFTYMVLSDEVKKQGYTVKDYKNQLSDMQTALPQEDLRVFYMRNHDTAWFYRFDGYSAEFFAYEAIHCLIKGIPLTFSGQKEYRGPDVKEFEFYKKLFTLRSKNKIMIEGKCLYNEIDVNNSSIFSAIRKDGNSYALVLVNTSENEIDAGIIINEMTISNIRGGVEVFDLFNEEVVKLESINKFNITMKPYGIRVLKYNTY